MTTTGYRRVSGTSPCKECPFRRTAPAGWLGQNSPQSFIAAISMEHPLPCHPTIDYADPDYLEKWQHQEVGQICAGSLILSANMGKRPRDPRFPRLPADDGPVFSNHLQFIAYHEAAGVRSWEMTEDAPREIRMARMARMAKTKTKTQASTPPAVQLTEEQLRKLIAHSRIGRQNAHTRAIRTDACAALEGREDGAAMKLSASVLSRLSTDARAIGVWSIERSPMNAQRWSLSLFCEHDAWVTSKSRPTARTHSCATCATRRGKDVATASEGTGNRRSQASPASPASPAGLHIRRFRVRIGVTIDVDQRLIDVAMDPEWQERFYALATSEGIAEHLAYNLVQNRRLTSLDGFADQEDDMARVEEIEVDEGDTEEVELSRPARRSPGRGRP